MIKAIKITLRTALLLFVLAGRDEGVASTASGKEASVLASARGVLARVVGDKAGTIRMELIPAEAKRDVYEFESKDGILTVRGSSPIALCRGFYDYAKSKGMGMVDWAEGQHLRIPPLWPEVPKTRVATPFEFRHAYNVVTLSYSMAYWTWERWERELDWQAMHGFNMLMAPVATEAIKERVWLKTGLTQAEIDDDTTAPSYLAWYRMGNMCHLGGPLSKEWHADQIALQHKILKRMRELGIEPVVQSFAGFVPKAFARIHPETKLRKTSWTALGEDTKTMTMEATDPQFAVLTKSYMDEWKQEFGPAKYFLVDSFNEMSPPRDRPLDQYFGEHGASIWKAMHAADPDAVWTMQGWLFGYGMRKKIWNLRNVNALMKTVPDDQMLILDYADEGGVWSKYCDARGAFGGKSWMMGYAPNMGGHTEYTGILSRYAALPAATVASARRGNLKGLSIEGEGIQNNAVIFELICDSAWRTNAIGLDDWIVNYCVNRYGRCPPPVIEAWKHLRRGSYASSAGHSNFAWQRSVFHQQVSSDAEFFAATKAFLSAADELKGNALYRADSVEMTALALGRAADQWIGCARRAYSAGDKVTFDKAATRSLELLTQVDQLLEAHPYHRLEPWVAFARSHGSTEAQKGAYETDAKRLVTWWGASLNNYACKVWGGLVRDYYREMLRLEFDAMKKGTRFDAKAFMFEYPRKSGASKFTPCNDPVADAQTWFKRAAEEKLPVPSKPIPVNLAGNLAGEWTPAQVATEWKTVEWPCPTEYLTKITGVEFIYTGGSHRLEIKSVELVLDNDILAADKHFGFAGIVSSNNTYKLPVPADASGNNTCVLRAVIKGGGGTDSRGTIKLLMKKK